MVGGGERDGGAETRRVRRENGTVWIEGMEGVDWGGSFFAREDSQVRCLVEALRGAGRDVTYAEVMGLSGAAFKLTMTRDLFVAEIHSEVGLDWPEVLSRVWGIDYQPDAIAVSDEENPGWREQLHRAAAESIGRGVPLFYMNGEWNLLVGYREDGSAFLARQYAGSEFGYEEHGKPHGFVGEAWFASTLRPAGEPALRRDAVLASLRAGADLAYRPAEKSGERHFGVGAYGVWIAALEENRPGVSLHGNAFSYSQLLTCRRAAAEYLRGVAGEVGGAAAAHLRQAADHYARIGQRLWDGRGCVEPPWEASWTPENRAAEAAILRACAAQERAAVAEIEAALTALGEEAPPRLARGDGAPGPRVTRESGGARIEGIALAQVQVAEGVWGASLPRAITRALQLNGADIGFAQVAAGSGWAFSFGYDYGNWHVAALGMDQFSWLPEQLGYRRHEVPCGERDSRQDLWQFVAEHIDAGRPVITTMGDGGLITGYRRGEGGLEILFDGEPMSGWVGLDTPHPLDRCAVLVREAEPRPRRDIVPESLARALAAARPHADRGTPLGLAALEAYRADVEDPAKDFDGVSEWFCWAAFERLTARQAGAEWLRAAAGVTGGEAADLLAAAADQYERAFRAYSEYDRLVHAEEGSGRSVQERLRTPEHIAALAPVLGQGIEAERSALSRLEAALGSMGISVETAGNGGHVGLPAGTAAAGEVLLPDLRRHEMPMNQLGSLLASARYLGYGESDAWLAGATGFAFALNVRPDLCPSGPSAWADHKLLPLAANAGLPVRTFYGADSQPDFEERRRQVFGEVRAAIDAGRPVIGTGMETPEVYLVQGYDGDGNYIYLDHVDGRPHKRPHDDLGFLWFQFPTLGAPADDRTTVREALAAALQLAAGTDFGSNTCGLQGYANWIAGLGSADGSDGLGAAYNAACWSACRRLVVPFLDEARRRLGDPDLAVPFTAAAAHYGVVAARLDRVAELFPLALDGPAMKERLADPSRREEARRALAEARDAEVVGLTALAALGASLGGPEVDVEAIAAAARTRGGAGAGRSAGTGDERAASSTSEGAHRLVGLECPRRIAAELACIEGALRFLEMELSPAWLYGGSGHAFAITMAPEVHIASPYAWQKTVFDLAPNLGFRLTGIKVAKREAGEAYPARQRAAWELVRDAIDRGLPCYADRVCRVPDYALVAGYDEVGYYYTHPAVTGGPTPWQQLGTDDIEGLDVWRVEPGEARPDEEIVRAALDTGLKRAATPTGWAMASWEGQVSGPAAFDLWAGEVESGRALRDAHGYNAMFWCEYREMAAAFL
ncbi:MAG: hypothetical protein ABIL09_27820, partial [Gemmatimonadota bacterium]